MSELLKGNSKFVGFEQYGRRDVYWCWILNEPMIIEFEGDLPKCSCCNWVDNEHEEIEKDGLPMPTPSKAFLTQHVFICHIRKPIER